MKKYDVGITDKEMYGEETAISSPKTRIIRPSFSLTQKQLLILKGKKFDEHFTIECDVRIEAIRSTENERTEKINYEIEVLKIGIKGMDKEESPEEYIANRKKKREIKED